MNAHHTVRLYNHSDHDDDGASKNRTDNEFWVKAGKERHAHDRQQNNQDGAKVGLNKNQNERAPKQKPMPLRNSLMLPPGENNVEHDGRIGNGKRLEKLRWLKLNTGNAQPTRSATAAATKEEQKQ